MVPPIVLLVAPPVIDRAEPPMRIETVPVMSVPTRLPSIRLPVDVVPTRLRASESDPARILAEPATVPPTVLFGPSTSTPMPYWASLIVPVMSRPKMFPSTRLPEAAPWSHTPSVGRMFRAEATVPPTVLSDPLKTMPP